MPTCLKSFSFFILYIQQKLKAVQINVLFQISPNCYGITNEQSYIACRRLFSFTGTAVTGVRLSRKSKQIFNKRTKNILYFEKFGKVVFVLFSKFEMFLWLRIMFQTSDQILLARLAWFYKNF